MIHWGPAEAFRKGTGQLHWWRCPRCAGTTETPAVSLNFRTARESSPFHPPISSRVGKIHGGTVVHLCLFPPYLASWHYHRFSKAGHGTVQASVSGEKQGSLSVLHRMGLPGQIGNIWKIDKEYWFPSSWDCCCNLALPAVTSKASNY